MLAKKLKWDYLLGNLVIPDRSSAKFTSFLGNIDRRVDLDRSIQPNDRRYYPSLSLMAAKLSYENEAFINNVVKDHWKMEFLGFVNFWNVDRLSDQPPFAYYTIRQMLKEILQKNKEAKFILTGHSLGGALAILFVSVLVLHEETLLLDRLEGVYTFGQPRVGDEQFGEYMKENLNKYDVNYRRYVYCNDLVPRLPYDDKTLFFKHFGPCLYFNSCYQGKVMEEEPNKNYFNLLWVAPKIINAVWELVRGFILPYKKGPDYREGWLLRLARVVGLVIPGLSAHSPQDYDNALRLGSLPSSPPL
ncbi:Lipase 3 domain-containing protein [Citrus sinensis]|nr:Lipase 3 domain-containing protein [Citrus sinensis]